MIYLPLIVFLYKLFIILLTRSFHLIYLLYNSFFIAYIFILSYIAFPFKHFLAIYKKVVYNAN